MKFSQVPIERFSHPVLEQYGVTVDVKRDDLIHPIISGNKLYKLHYNLEAFQEGGFKTLITFGGAYSNHVHATAYAGMELGVNTVGVIRGEQLLPLNPTLKDCVDWGMTLEPVSRGVYRNKENDSEIQAILSKYEKPFLVPEGGGNTLGVKGASLMLETVKQQDYDLIVVASGTGATVAGLIYASGPLVKVLGVATLKGVTWMAGEVRKYLQDLKCANTNWSINCDYHFGGYGKKNAELDEFVKSVSTDYGLPIEPIYTGRALYGLLDLVAKGEVTRGSRVLFIHSGGLQGARS